MEKGFLKRIMESFKSNKQVKGNFSGLSDENIVEFFINEKSEAAFEEIFNRYVNKIYGLALRITRDPNHAEEIVQEVFLTLTRKIDTFRGESKFSSWLYRITANSSYMHIRSEKKHQIDISLDNYVPYDENGTLMGRIKDKDWSSRPDLVVFNKEALEIIDRAVNELPHSYREVFHLRDIEGLSTQEVSEILGLSVPALKSRLHRARLYLRDKISDYFYEWGQSK